MDFKKYRPPVSSFSSRLLFSSPLLFASQAQVVSGSSGRGLWSAEFVCPYLHLDPTAIATSGERSIFLFWASEPIRAQRNATKTTVGCENF